MELAKIALLLIVILNIGMALLVFLANPKSPVNRLFVFFILSVIVWISSLFFSNTYNSFTLLWTKITFFGAILIGLFLAYFSLYFPKLYKTIEWWKDLVVLIPTLIIIYIMFFTEKIIAGVTMLSNGTGVQQGDWYYIWPAYFIPLIFYSFWVLINKYRKAHGKERKQLKYVFTGLAISIILALTTNLILPFLFKNDILGNIIGPYSALFFIGFTAFAIVKYEFLNIKVIATETLVVVINIALLFNLLYSETFNRGLTNGAIFLFSILAGYLLIKSVIKEIKQKEQLQTLSTQLAHANAHLKELDRMKTEFVSLASHELLTPVSAIEGYLSMLLDEKLAKIEDPKALHYMDRVYNSAKRLARLVTDMLNVSRIEEGRLLVQKREVSLLGLFQQVIDELKFKAEERKQKIVLASTNHWITYGDPDKIKEVAINIIGNSIKYSKNPGTITIAIETVPTRIVEEIWNRISGDIKDRPIDDQEAIKSSVDEHLKCFVGDNQILVHIKDEGIGIPKAELPRLFTKFHRVGDYTTAESQGTGLGLYISRALVELHHGRIWADSEGAGKGSTFTFSLPEVAVQEDIRKIEAQAPQNQNKEKLKPLARPTKEAEEL